VLRSPGQPLDAATRAVLEPRFGHDFSRIRIHTDAQAADSARAVNALAYTVGEDVVFGRGQYRPESSDGQRLIAHELAHTIQQAGGTGELKPSESGLEREAESASRAALEGRDVTVNSAAPLGLSRQPAPGAAPSLAPAASSASAVETDPNTIDGFVTGRAEISPANLAKLRLIAARVLDAQKAHPGSTVLVVGHTDAQGNEGDNMALGMRRAVATRDALIKMGVPAAVLVPISKGQSEPVESSGPKDNPRNRRAEVKYEAAAPAQPAAPKMEPTPPPEPTPQFQDPRKDPRLFPQPQWPQPQEQPQVRPPYKPPAPEPPKPIPPIPKGLEPKSPLQRINEVLDREVNRITRAMGLPKWAQDKAKELAHTAFLKGTTAGLAAALAGLGVDAKGQQAMVDFVEAALKENRWEGPPPNL
jgi:outer membrane protein OmpA-like peptidoglycan-associated protein